MNMKMHWIIKCVDVLVLVLVSSEAEAKRVSVKGYY